MRKGLLLFDLNSVKFIIPVFVLIDVAIPMGFASGSTFPLALMGPIICAPIVASTYYGDASYGWAGYAISLGVTRKEFVASRCVIGIIGVLIGIVCSVIDMAILIPGSLSDPKTYLQLLMGAFAGLAVSSFLIYISMRTGGKMSGMASSLATTICVALSVALNTCSDGLVVDEGSVLICTAVFVVLLIVFYILCNRFVSRMDL